jgi:alkyl sulfatase BDS1-like metallo-beta-lactamase superfamily hydrolase
VNAEVFKLIGDSQTILNRAQELFDTDQPQLALQVLDVLLKADPDHIEGRRLHYRLLEVLCESDTCLMSRNTWVYFMEKDKELLKEKGVDF